MKEQSSVRKIYRKNEHFFTDVFAVVNLIPQGRVTTYGAIGEYLGGRGLARMVGWAMSASHAHSSSVPAHRVVNSSGELSGRHHFGSPDAMQKLLEAEGVRVVNDKVDGFKTLFWNPVTELEI